MNPADRKHVRERLYLELMDLFLRERKFHTCVSCSNFEAATEVCRLAGQRPPAEVIVLGCPSYVSAPPF
jgi:multimeric flavodoxin WrbA